MFVDKYSSFIFDLDGTIYRGKELIPEADVTYNKLKAMNKQSIFISNKTTGSVSEYYEILRNFGLKLKINEILIATDVIKKYMSENHKGDRFYCIGEAGFIKEIENAGLAYSEEPADVDVVIITLDRYLNNKKIETAASAVAGGAVFIAANIDSTCPVESGEITDAGTVIKIIEEKTGRKLQKHFGKPSEYMFREIMERIGSPLSECLLVGDRLETDIAMGNKFGIDTALVLTGIKPDISSSSRIKPTYVLNSVADILKRVSAETAF